jgi:hypothetical protein
LPLKFRFADKTDKVLIAFGTISAIVAGIIFPIQMILVGNIGGSLAIIEKANQKADLNLTQLNQWYRLFLISVYLNAGKFNQNWFNKN